MVISQEYVNELAYQVVGAAIEVHKHLGPGLMESVYHKCMVAELSGSGLDVTSEFLLPVEYKGMIIGSALRIDIMVNDVLIVELKAVEQMVPLYSAQLLTYLKLAKKPKGLLINFNCKNIIKDLVPLVTEEFSKLPVNKHKIMGGILSEKSSEA
jgi:GxxExxY protein